jgi:hypothetical protein
MQRFWIFIFVVASCSALSDAQQRPAPRGNIAGAETGVDSDPRQLQVQAATANGAAALREQVLRLHLTRDISVREFVDHTHSGDELSRALASAQPEGGPRWVDEQTCQVQLDIPGSRVEKFLLKVADQNPGQSPVPPELLARRLGAWTDLKFSAIGSSAGGTSIDLARPKTAGRWEQIDDSSRRQAVEQAQADAVHQVIKGLREIQLGSGRRMSDALARPLIAGRVTEWLDRQPVTRIEFADDLKVSVTLAPSPQTLGRVLKSAVAGDTEFVRAGSPVDWDRVRKQIDATPASVVGTATAAAPAQSALPTVILPLQPPDWVDQQLDAEATVRGEGSRLKLAHAAESEATERIKSQFLILRLDANTTLGDASRSDPQIADAVARAMRFARTCKVDYQPNGQVHVRVSLDMHDAWDELRASP